MVALPRRRASALGGLLAVTLIAGVLYGTPANAVAGGSPVTDYNQEFVAKIRIGDLRSCSGALIGDTWVITAKSCFADGTKPVVDGAPPVPTTAAINGHVFNVIDIRARTDRDVALLHLSRRDFKMDPLVGISSTPPQPGETLRVAGYGRTSDQWVPGLAQTAQMAVGSVDATTFSVQAGGASICKGDAGGPVYRDGWPSLVGLHAASWQNGCLGAADTQRGGTETRLDDLVNWVSSMQRTYPLTAVGAMGKYATAENSGSSSLIADRTELNIWGLYDFVDAGNGYTALRNRGNGMYVTAENAGKSALIANRTAIGVWEQFTLVDEYNGEVALIAHANGKYVTAPNGGASPLIASSTTVGTAELFELAPDIWRSNDDVAKLTGELAIPPAGTSGNSAIEDGAYPNADAIEATQHIKLISGDGQIVVADCNTPPTGDIGLIKVYTTEQIGQIGPNGEGRVCLMVLGPVGRLDLLVPAVYEVRGDGLKSGAGHEGTATASTDSGGKVTKNLSPSGSIQFGIGEGGPEPATLLQITVSP